MSVSCSQTATAYGIKRSTGDATLPSVHESIRSKLHIKVSSASLLGMTACVVGHTFMLSYVITAVLG
jgi:hypothetical protein